MSRFAVPCPEAGENAIINFSIDDLERLEDEFGDQYLKTISDALDRLNIKIVKAVLLTALKGGDPDLLMRTIPVSDVAKRLADGLALILYGKTISEMETPAALSPLTPPRSTS
jgi:hypothetical protein